MTQSIAKQRETHEAIQYAAASLANSSRGRDALARLHAWLSDTGCGLDSENQEHVTCLLEYAWQGYAGSVIDAMAEFGEVKLH